MQVPFHWKFTVLLFVSSLCLSPIANAEETPADLPGAKISSAGEGLIVAAALLLVTIAIQVTVRAKEAAESASSP